jgi:hypothetical protein
MDERLREQPMQRHRFIAGMTTSLQAAIGTAMGCLLALPMLPAVGQPSTLLDQVKQNPSRGKALCQQLRQLNSQGTSFTSQQVTTQIARQQGISQPDAEILLTYVVGLYCPDVT